MPVSGQGKLKTLIIGEAPGDAEDERGSQFVSRAGGELMTMLYDLGINMRQDCWLYNALSCRPHTESGQHRNPVSEEVAWCRPNVINLLAKLQPERIILLGKWAVMSVLHYAWKDDNAEYSSDGEMARWAGWMIPSTKLNAWLCPTYHPSFVIRNQERNSATRMIVREHLRAAFATRGKPYTVVPDYSKQVRIELDPVKAARAIRVLAGSGRPIAFDYETNMLKPWHKNSRILCCAICDGQTALAYPWVGDAITATSALLKSNTPKIGANAKFEENWTRQHLGHGVTNWQWDDMLGAHWGNAQHGICSVKFQAFVRLGVPHYAGHLESLMRDKDSYGTNRLHEAALPDLLMYCGLDALYEWLICEKQRKVNNGPADMERDRR